MFYMFITWRLASKLFRGVLVICEAWNIGSCKLLSLKLRVLLFVKLKLTFMFYLLWWYSRTCTCRVSRVKTRPPSLSMPTDLKTSSDFASSFVLKAPLEINSSFCVWNKYIFYMTEKSHVPCVLTKINSYLNASNQDEGFNRESKGRPLKVWHTPESVGIWELHGYTHYTLYKPFVSNLLELTTLWVSVNTWFRNVMQSFQFLFIIIQRFVSPEQDLPIFRNSPEVFSTLMISDNFWH